MISFRSIDQTDRERHGAVHAVIFVSALLWPLAGCLSRRDFAVPAVPAPVHASSVSPAELPAGPLTAREAVRLVLIRNPRLEGARARIESALAGIDAADAALWPRLSADASVLRADAPSAYLFKHIDARRLAPGIDFNRPGAFDNTEAGLTLRWNLWAGGRDLLSKWIAESSADLARDGRRGLENALTAATLAACLDVRVASELTEADEASARSVESQVAEIRTKLEGGSALRSDLLSLEVRLAEARQRKIESDVARRTALASLRHLLAWPMDTPIALSDDGRVTDPLPSALSEAVAEAWQHRPETAAARRSVERARMSVRSAEAAWSPRLDLESRVYGDGTDGFLSTRDANWTAALALSFDLADGGARAAGVRQAKAALEEMEAADRQALLDVAFDVEMAWLRHEAAQARLDVATQAVAAGEETLTLVDAQFRGGGTTVTRFLEAEAARTQARTAVIRARLDLERAAVDALRAMGRWGGAE